MTAARRGLLLLRRPKTLAGKAFAGLLVCVILLVVVWFVALFITERRLAAAMKRAEVEFGFSNNIDDYIPAILPPEQNAMVPLDNGAAIAAEILQSAPRWTTIEAAKTFRAENPKIAAKLSASDIDRLLDESDRKGTFSPSATPPRPWIVNNSAPHFSRRRLLEAEIIVALDLLDKGHPDDAVRRLVRALRLARQWTAVEPYFGDVVSDHVRRDGAIKVLNHLLRTASIESSLHEAIDREMTEQSNCRRLGARLYHIQKLKWLEDFSINPDRQRAWWLVGPLAANDLLHGVNWYDLMIEKMNRPYSEAHDELEAANAELWRIHQHPFDRLLHPDVLSVTSHQQRRSFDYLRTISRCLRVVNAMAKQKRWDADLDSLGLPEEALIDPINGKRLHVKETATGPIVYSVGFDGEDNGGVLEGKTLMGMDIGLGPPKAKDAAK